MTHLRRHVDDDAARRGAVGRLEHFPDRSLCHQEGRSNVKREHFIQMRFRYFDKRLGNVHAGVIHEDVESLESNELGSNLPAVGDVADENCSAPASFDDVLLNFFKLASCPAQEKHFGARLSEGTRYHGAKTATGAGHQRNAAIQPERCRKGGTRYRRYRGYGLSPALETRPTSRPA